MTATETSEEEPLLLPDDGRFVLFPIQDNKVRVHHIDSVVMCLCKEFNPSTSRQALQINFI